MFALTRFRFAKGTISKYCGTFGFIKPAGAAAGKSEDDVFFAWQPSKMGEIKEGVEVEYELSDVKNGKKSPVAASVNGKKL